MAGTNQAANLGGMLSQIGGSLRAGISQENMDRLSGNIERMSKPALDMNDLESVKRNAQWYHDVGKDREAMALGEQYSDMRKEKAAQENMSQAMGMFAQAEKNANLGRVEDFDANIAGIRKAAAGAPNAQTQLQLHQMANQAAAGRDNVVAKNTQVQVGNIAKIDGVLGNEEAAQKMDPRAVGAMKEARAKLYAQPEVRKAYDAQKLKEVQTTADTVKAQAVVDDSNIRKTYGQLKAKGDPQALATFEKQVRDAGNGDILDNIAMEQGRKEQFDMELQEMKADASRPAQVPSALSSLITALPDTPQTAGIKAAYDGLKLDIQKYNDNKGKTDSADVYSGQSLKQIEAKATSLFGIAASISTAKSTADSAELKGYQKQVVKAQQEIATIAGSVRDTDIEAKAKSLLGQGKEFFGGTSAEDNIYETNVTYNGEELTAYEAAKQFLINERTAGLQESLRIANENIARLSGNEDTVEAQLEKLIAAKLAEKTGE